MRSDENTPGDHRPGRFLFCGEIHTSSDHGQGRYGLRELDGELHLGRFGLFQRVSFQVSHDENGQPRLVITASDAAVYRVQRDAVGESFILTELRAEAGQTLTYVDDRARDGVVYTYRVIPVHAELLDNGILLEGKQSVQVARVERPSFGNWLQGLFRREDDDEDEADRPASMFSQ